MTIVSKLGEGSEKVFDERLMNFVILVNPNEWKVPNNFTE